MSEHDQNGAPKKNPQADRPQPQLIDKCQPLRIESRENSSDWDNGLTSSEEDANSNHQPTQAKSPAQAQPFPVAFLFELILHHLLSILPDSNRKSRLSYLLLQLREKQPLREIMEKFDKKDLTVIAQHKKLLETLEGNFRRILQKVEYRELRGVDYKKIIVKLYSFLSLEINLSLIRTSLLEEELLRESELGQRAVEKLVEELLLCTRKDFEENAIKYVTEEDQLMMSRIFEEETEVAEEDPFLAYSAGGKNQYDQISKYGIFSSMEEEQQRSKEGVVNYRIHRTLFTLERLNIIKPLEDIRTAKSLALFIVHLTDAHIAIILTKSSQLASQTSRPNVDEKPMNELTYFSRKGPPTQEVRQQPIKLLRYPSTVQRYMQLRQLELLQQHSLYEGLRDELIGSVCRGKRRLSRDEKAVVGYVSEEPRLEECMGKLRNDLVREPAAREKRAVEKVTVQARHIRHFLESHSFYRDHMILWRFHAIH